jgi:beta-lactamase regulating signal transducer with metallopeptidase domain
MLFFALIAVIDWIRLQRLVKTAHAPPADVLSRYASLAGSYDIKRLPLLRVTEELESPALAGVLSPVILLPSWLVREPDPVKLDWSLRHELMHWKLLDPLANVVRELAQVLFYFHPVAWWVGKKWDEAVELACDRAIVTNEADSNDYAELGRLLGLCATHGARRAHESSASFQ